MQINNRNEFIFVKNAACALEMSVTIEYLRTYFAFLETAKGSSIVVELIWTHAQFQTEFLSLFLSN